MTKKDYELIAGAMVETINDLENNYNEGTELYHLKLGVFRATDKLLEAFERNNPRFSVVKWNEFIQNGLTARGL